MKKLFCFILFISFTVISCESRKVIIQDVSDLKIYFVYDFKPTLIYDNESEFYNRKIANGFLNAPKYREFALFGSKGHSDLILEGHYLINLKCNGEDFSYSSYFEDMVYDEKDGKAYRYSFCYDLYQYYTQLYFLNNYIPEESKDMFMTDTGIKSLKIQ